jgi:hypothetical protein
LEVEARRGLSMRLLADLKEAWDRLNQGPDNSSRPPSRRAPWARTGGARAADAAAAAGAREPEPAERNPEEPTVVAPPAAAAKPASAPAARKAGKPPGAPGMGRTPVFQAPAAQRHYPAVGAGGGRPLDRAGAVAYTGLQAVDLHWGDSAQPGLTLWVVEQRYSEIACGCGHPTRAEAGPGVVDPGRAGIELSDWRLVGPGLAARRVALARRFRLSRARLQEFLGEGLGLDLRLGTIQQTSHAARAAVAPAEEARLQAVLDSDRLHADATSWPEHGRRRWRWVCIAATVTLYYVAGRGKEGGENVLAGFTGWLLTAGWMAYRAYRRRLRCGAPLRRQARGWTQGSDGEARACGQLVLDTVEVLMAAVYAAREGPPPVARPTQHAPLVAAVRAAGERRQDSQHQQTHALAVELLTDGEALFQVLSHPELPLTTNEAARALRHGVIRRQLRLGTRTAGGARVVALLASVIDTCRQRGHSPWRYLERAMADRRAGQPLAALPR